MTTTAYDFEDPRRFGPHAADWTVEPLKLSESDPRFSPLSPERQMEIMGTAMATLRALPTQRPRKAPAGTPQTYLVGADGSPLVKIGYTTTDPRKRLAGLQTGLPMVLSLLWTQLGNYERALHRKFAEYRVRGEWFDLTSFGEPIDAVKVAVAEIDRQTGTE